MEEKRKHSICFSLVYSYLSFELFSQTTCLSVFTTVNCHARLPAAKTKTLMSPLILLLSPIFVQSANPEGHSLDIFAKLTTSFELLFETRWPQTCYVAKGDLDLRLLLLCLWNAGMTSVYPTPKSCGAGDRRQSFAERGIPAQLRLTNHRHFVWAGTDRYRAERSAYGACTLTRLTVSPLSWIKVLLHLCGVFAVDVLLPGATGWSQLILELTAHLLHDSLVAFVFAWLWRDPNSTFHYIFPPFPSILASPFSFCFLCINRINIFLSFKGSAKKYPPKFQKPYSHGAPSFHV